MLRAAAARTAATFTTAFGNVTRVAQAFDTMATFDWESLNDIYAQGGFVPVSACSNGWRSTRNWKVGRRARDGSTYRSSATTQSIYTPSISSG